MQAKKTRYTLYPHIKMVNLVRRDCTELFDSIVLLNLKTFFFYLIIFIDLCKYMLILNLMAATRCKQVWTGATKDWEIFLECLKNMIHYHDW